MGLHERAWEGLEIMVFGSTPMLPMKLEQSISEISPNNEVRVVSFEKYEDAFDYCKKTRDVGVIVLNENCGTLPFDQVFRELGKAYEARGFPCFGFLLHEGTQSFIGRRQTSMNPRLLDYLPVEALLDTKQTAQTLNRMWERFIEGFQHQLLPQALSETFSAALADKNETENMSFEGQVGLLLTADLNVSWIESVSIQWNPLIRRVQEHFPTLLRPHGNLVQISGLSEPGNSGNTLIEMITRRDVALPKRIVAAARTLNHHRLSGTLHTTLQTLGTQSKPGAPAMLRHLVRNRDRILQFAHDLSSAQNSERASGRAQVAGAS